MASQDLPLVAFLRAVALLPDAVALPPRAGALLPDAVALLLPTVANVFYLLPHLA